MRREILQRRDDFLRNPGARVCRIGVAMAFDCVTPYLHSVGRAISRAQKAGQKIAAAAPGYAQLAARHREHRGNRLVRNTDGSRQCCEHQ